MSIILRPAGNCKHFLQDRGAACCPCKGKWRTAPVRRKGFSSSSAPYGAPSPEGKARGRSNEVGRQVVAYTGLGVARFFADGQFALIQANAAQNDARVGPWSPRGRSHGPRRHPTPLPPSHGGGTLGLGLGGRNDARVGPWAPRVARTGLGVTVCTSYITHLPSRKESKSAETLAPDLEKQLISSAGVAIVPPQVSA